MKFKLDCMFNIQNALYLNNSDTILAYIIDKYEKNCQRVKFKQKYENCACSVSSHFSGWQPHCQSFCRVVHISNKLVLPKSFYKKYS